MTAYLSLLWSLLIIDLIPWIKCSQGFRKGEYDTIATSFILFFSRYFAIMLALCIEQLSHTIAIFIELNAYLSWIYMSTSSINFLTLFSVYCPFESSQTLNRILTETNNKAHFGWLWWETFTTRDTFLAPSIMIYCLIINFEFVHIKYKILILFKPFNNMSSLLNFSNILMSSLQGIEDPSNL